VCRVGNRTAFTTHRNRRLCDAEAVAAPAETSAAAGVPEQKDEPAASEGAAAAAADDDDGEKLTAWLESLHTHTLFFLAQVGACDPTRSSDRSRPLLRGGKGGPSARRVRACPLLRGGRGPSARRVCRTMDGRTHRPAVLIGGLRGSTPAAHTRGRAAA
jgi:hypothetical protein